MASWSDTSGPGRLTSVEYSCTLYSVINTAFSLEIYARSTLLERGVSGEELEIAYSYGSTYRFWWNELPETD